MITEIGKTRDRIVFGFSELRPYSYVDSHNDSGFFISFLDRLKKLSSIDWNTANVSAHHSYGLEKMNVCDMTRAAQSHVPEGMSSPSWSLGQQVTIMCSLVIERRMSFKSFLWNISLAMYIVIAIKILFI